MRESVVQKGVITIYEKRGWLVVKIIQSTKNGWPDLQCHKNGITVFIEVKTPRGKVSKLQEFRHDELKRQGFKVLIIDNIDNIII